LDRRGGLEPATLDSFFDPGPLNFICFSGVPRLPQNLDTAVLVAETSEGLPVKENELMRPQSGAASGTRKLQQNSLAAESSLGIIA